MADESIKKDFIDGIHEVFSTLFNDGVNDGVYLYLLKEPEKKSIYREVKNKTYSEPILLVAKVQLTPVQGEQDVKGIKNSATFTVPFKSLRDNGIDVENKNLPNVRKGFMQYKDTFYEIDLIVPKTFVADTYMAYEFHCTEDPNIKELEVISDE